MRMQDALKQLGEYEEEAEEEEVQAPKKKIENKDIIKSKNNEEQMVRYLSHLSYCQFHINEMEDGTAWRILHGGC